MVFSNTNYEKAFPRKPEQEKAAAPKVLVKEPGNVLEEAEKVTVKEPAPEPEPDPVPEGGEDDGAE